MMLNDIQRMKKDLQAGRAILIDVREKPEWDAEHLNVAWLVPLSELEENRFPATLPQDKTLYLHCRSGVRVFRATPILEDMGFAQVVPLKESFSELARHGFEVKSGKTLHLDVQATGECTFEAKNLLGLSTIMDGPQNLGGTFAGLRPMETVLAGLAGCSAVDIVHIMKKARKSIHSLNVSIDGKRADTVPAVFESIHLHFSAEGDFDEKSLKRACKLSVEKYCSVASMLQQSVSITHSCEKL